MVLYDGPGASLHCQDAGHLQDDVLRRRPARQGARQLHTNHLEERGRRKYFVLSLNISRVCKVLKE